MSEEPKDQPVEAGAPVPSEPNESGAQAAPPEGDALAEASAAEGMAEGETLEEAPAEGEAGEGEALDLSKSKLASAPAPEGEEAADEAQPEPVDLDALRRTCEALLFASEGVLTAREIARAASTKTSAVRKVLEAMQAAYEQEGRAWMLAEIAGGWRLVTRPEYFPAIQKLKAQRAMRKLTPAALETLALIAYSKEPVGRADIESVRGVDAGPILRQLLDRKLVKIAGRSEGLGRALLYVVTTDFLEHFGLKSTEELPRAGEFKNA
ncbi:MAG: SMC-Scp complex subunit ScpB [Planctomycetes bacterium]|nr:SMC-Scp complex subunit ScpB [Planctomycetota bacterium]